MEEMESVGGSPISTSLSAFAVVLVAAVAAVGAKNDIVVGGCYQSCQIFVSAVDMMRESNIKAKLNNSQNGCLGRSRKLASWRPSSGLFTVTGSRSKYEAAQVSHRFQ